MQSRVELDDCTVMTCTSPHCVSWGIQQLLWRMRVRLLMN